jgi:hypothetical protein
VPEDPLASVRPRAAFLRQQAEQSLRAIEAAKEQSPAVNHAVGSELWGALGGAVSRELFGRSRPGSKIGRAIAKSNQKSQRIQQERAARDQAVGFVHQARQIVDEAGPQLSLRTKSCLRSGLATAESAKTPATVLRRTAAVVARLEEYRPPAPRVPSPPPFPSVLHDLEVGLRTCIEKRLSALTPNWWLERVPKEQRERAEWRKASRERVWPWLDGGEHSVVEYLDFPDYAKIILEPANWGEAFAPVFVDPDSLRVKLKELEPIRNDVAHSRPLTKAHRNRLETYAEDILTAIGRT